MTLLGLYLPIGVLCLLLLVAIMAIMYLAMAVWQKYAGKHKAKMDLDSERESAQIELLKKIKAQNDRDDSVLNSNGNVKWTRYTAVMTNFKAQRVEPTEKPFEGPTGRL